MTFPTIDQSDEEAGHGQQEDKYKESLSLSKTFAIFCDTSDNYQIVKWKVVDEIICKSLF